MVKKIKVENIEEKIRLDAYISKKDENLSRSMIQKLLETGKITINGKIEKASYKVQKRRCNRNSNRGTKRSKNRSARYSNRYNI